ncbi:hypothetical protein [Flavobacterium sp.]|uniref:hypothetical protein n=1 Tax=Flavobacterium sp. TaxID=239 RepID=UPI0039E3A262
MKTITYLVAFTFTIGSLGMTAQNRVMETERGITVNHTIQAEPIVFMERGIEFFVFLNGDFDFNTRPNDSHGGIFYRRGGTRGTTAVAVNYGVRIEHDSFGRVRRVGNTFINYDSRNRVSRIGSIFMNYNRFGLSRIGGMEIVYNRRGMIVDTIGHVNGWRGNHGYAHTTYYGNYNYYYGNDYNDGYAYNENDYYYYKADGTKALIKDKKEK